MPNSDVDWQGLNWELLNAIIDMIVGVFSPHAKCLVDTLCNKCGLNGMRSSWQELFYSGFWSCFCIWSERASFLQALRDMRKAHSAAKPRQNQKERSPLSLIIAREKIAKYSKKYGSRCFSLALRYWFHQRLSCGYNPWSTLHTHYMELCVRLTAPNQINLYSWHYI